MTWDEIHLIVFHIYSDEGADCNIMTWKICDDPRFVYEGSQLYSQKSARIVVNNLIILPPRIPLEAKAPYR